MKIRNNPWLRRSALAWVLLAVAASAASGQGEQAPRVSARSLIAIASGSLGTIQRAASGDARLASEPGRIAPFWAALQGANQALAEVAAALGSPGGPPAGDLFSRIARAGGRIAELGAAWERVGVANIGIQAGFATLSTSWTVFRGTYGPEGVRHRQDRLLSADEARRLEVVRRAQEQLARQLERLEAQARRAHATEEARRLARFRNRTQHSLPAGDDLDAYLTALAALPEIEGEWAAIRAAAPKSRRAAYAAVDPIVEQIQTEADTGSVTVLDLDQGKAWSFLEQTTELPESLAPELLSVSGLEGEEGAGALSEPEGDASAAEPGEAEEPESACAEDDEKCLAEQEALAAEEAGATSSEAGAETVAASPEAPIPFPGTCDPSTADGCMAAPEVPAEVPPLASSPASMSPPPGA